MHADVATATGGVERSPGSRPAPDASPGGSACGCQSPLDGFFDPACQSPMDRFFEGPPEGRPMPCFFGINQLGGASTSAGAVSTSTVLLPNQPQPACAPTTLTGATAMTTFGPVGFTAWPCAPNIGAQFFLCPPGSVGNATMQVSAMPQAVGMAANGVTTPMAAVTAGLPSLLRNGVPDPRKKRATKPEMGPVLTHGPAPSMRIPNSDEVGDPTAPGSSDGRPACPTAVFVDLTCLREKKH